MQFKVGNEPQLKLFILLFPIPCSPFPILKGLVTSPIASDRLVQRLIPLKRSCAALKASCITD